MSNEIKADDKNFDRILKRMLELPPLTKAEISARIQAEKAAKKAAAFEKFKEKRKARKSS